jgi:hypothetical protein
MKLAAIGLVVALALTATAAMAQVGGPNKGPKPVIGGQSTGPTAGASVGGPNKGAVTTGSSSTATPKKGH